MTKEKGRETRWQAGSVEDPAYQRTCEMIRFSGLLREKKERQTHNKTLGPLIDIIIIIQFKLVLVFEFFLGKNFA